MDPKEIRALRNVREKIMDDVDPKYINEHLLQNGILSLEDYKEIEAQITPQKRANKFLEILPKRRNSFRGLIEALNHDDVFYWIATELQEEFKKQNAIMPNTRKHSLHLSRGGVPRQREYHVNREKEVEEVKTKLIEEFPRRGCVVLHGMTGIGKSTIAAAAVSDDPELLTTYFNSVFWVSCGMIEQGEGLLLMKMKALCEKLDKEYRNCSFDSIDIAKERLRELFSKPDNYDALLVLDDVCNQVAIDAFNVGCHTLVTTTDRGIMSNVPCVSYVSIPNSFSEEQSLELLGKCANREVKELPSNAREIHNLCKGVPMLIATVGGYISDFPQDEAKWATCERTLARKKNLTGERKFLENIDQAIELSLKNLTDEQRYHYGTFAIFRDDVYIPRQVLATFWECSDDKVDEIMLQFIKKSLANRVWDDKAGTYQYIIHDIHLKYVKELNQAKIKDLNEKLIRLYEKKCNGKWQNLEDDCYIFTFIAYHLHMAGMNDLMKEIYFNFDFIKAKISNTTTADLVYDYQKYFKDFSDDEKLKVLDFKQFIRSHTDLLTSDYDILQLALCQPDTSEVYKKAKEVTLTKGSHKYYEWCNKDKMSSYCISSYNIHNSPVQCAVFTPSGGKVISCDNAGKIRIWDCTAGEELVELPAHNGAIRYCSICEQEKILATCGADHTIKLWTVPANFFDDLNGNNSDDGSNHSPPIPNVTKRRSNPQWLMENYETKNYYMMTFNVPEHDPWCCAISNDGKAVVSGGADGLVYVWSIRNGDYDVLKGHDNRVTCCQYNSPGHLLATGSIDGRVIVWDTAEYSIRRVLSGVDSPITSCCFLTDELKVIAAVDNKVISWEVESNVVENLFQDCTECQILSVAACDNYLAAGTAGAVVMIYSLAEKKLHSYIGHKNWVRSVTFSRQSNMLLSVSEDESIKIWKTEMSFPSNLKMGNFCDAAFQNDSVTMALVNTDNRVEVIRGTKSQYIESDNNNVCISCCAISNKAQLIALCYENGLIKIFGVKDSSDPIVTRKAHTQNITCCEFSGNDSHLITGSLDCCIAIIPVNEVAPDQRLIEHTELITQVKFFALDKKIVSASYDKTLAVWDITTRTVIFKCVGHSDSIVFCDVSNDDKMLLSASTDKHANLWDATDGRLLQSFPHKSCVRSCKFLSNCAQVVTGDDDGNITIWDMKNDATPVRVMKCDGWVVNLIVCGESKYLLSGSKNLRWWEIETGKCVHTFHTKGNSLRKVQASTDFTSIVCIDNAKTFYHLEAIQKP